MTTLQTQYETQSTSDEDKALDSLELGGSQSILEIMFGGNDEDSEEEKVLPKAYESNQPGYLASSLAEGRILLSSRGIVLEESYRPSLREKLVKYKPIRIPNEGKIEKELRKKIAARMAGEN